MLPDPVSSAPLAPQTGAFEPTAHGSDGPLAAPPSPPPGDGSVGSLDAPADQTPPRRRYGKTITIVLLSVLSVALIALFALAYLRLEEALGRIGDLEQEIDEQKELIDKKETFGAAMEDLLTTARSFEGVRVGTVVPLDKYQSLATSGWDNRWIASRLDEVTASVNEEKQALVDALAAAEAQRASNATGTGFEATLDQLSGGFASSVIDDASALCGGEAWACVSSDDPQVVHFDAAGNGLPYMNDTIRAGVSYHEYAHVLQFTNPDATEIAVASFGGDWETMADCFALTYLPGWQLDHTIWVSSFEYWEISVGYGYTCDEPQRQVIRDWYEPLGITISPITQ